MSRGSGRRPHPLLRRAPIRLAYAPSWSLVLVGVSALLVAALVAPGWFLHAAEDAALGAKRGAADSNAFGTDSANVRVTWTGRIPKDVEADYHQALRDLPGYADPVTTGSGAGETAFARPLVSAHGRSVVAVLWTHDGAVDTLAGSGAAPPGLWLPRSLGEELGVHAGDPVQLSITAYSTPGLGDHVVSVPLAGLYDPVEGSTLPAALQSLGLDPLAYPWRPDSGAGTALAVTDAESFRSWCRQLRDAPRYTADLRLEGDPTPARFATAVAAVERFEKRLYEPGDVLRTGLDTAKPEPITPQVVTAAPAILRGARIAADQSRVQVTPFVRATVLLAVGLLLVALVLLASRRSLEHESMTASGMSLLQRGLVATLELVPVAVLAAPMGLLLAWADVRFFGPPGRPGMAESRVEAALLTAGGLAVVLVAGAAVAVVTALRQERLPGRRHTSALGRASVWRAGVLVLGVVVAVAAVSSEPAGRAAGPLTLLFPLATAGAVAVTATWLWQLLRPRLPRWPCRPGSGAWLARHRSSLATLVPVTLALVVGLSVLGYGLAVRRGVQDSVADKTAGLAGARTTVDLGQQLQGVAFRRLPDLAGPDSTVIHTRPATLPPAFGSHPLWVVEPAELDRVADWGATLGGEARRALHLLAVASERAKADTLASPDDAGLAPVPVILVGPTDQDVGDLGTMALAPGPLVPITVVAVLDTFPGTTAASPDVTVVAARSGLFARRLTGIDPRIKSESTLAGEFSAQVWSGRSTHDLRAALEGEGLVGEHEQTIQQVGSRPELLASGWAVGYLGPLEVGAALLVVAAVVLLARRLVERDVVTDLLLQRMGWTRRELAASRARELVAALVVAWLAAALTIWLLVRAPTTIETVPQLPPLTRPHLDTRELVTWLGGVVGVLVAGLLVLARGSRTPPEEVLRGNR
ncbi:hypothetical protein [Nocardioides sp.]|uniref:hypothetical protein n=1 Tax=Nocardioides sp. TaxID=35761 RepID=UPI003529B328